MLNARFALGLVLVVCVFEGRSLADRATNLPPIEIENSVPTSPDETSCRRAGGVWDGALGICFVSEQAHCTFIGNFWSEILNTCYALEIDRTNAEAEPLCLRDGNVWDSVNRYCLTNLDAIECRDRGGIWEYESRQCFLFN